VTLRRGDELCRIVLLKMCLTEAWNTAPLRARVEQDPHAPQASTEDQAFDADRYETYRLVGEKLVEAAESRINAVLSSV
jgi:hypothetical protein